MIVTLRAEIVVLGHQVTILERELVELMLVAAVSSTNNSEARFKLQGELAVAKRLFDYAFDTYQEVLEG